MKRELYFILFLVFSLCVSADVKIGFNYPQSGNYKPVGKDQKRGALMAQQEINSAGGILGEKIVFIEKDSKTDPKVSYKNAVQLTQEDQVKMIFGGSSSAVARAVTKVAKKNKVLFFGTITASNALTDVAAHRHFFRSCYNSWMASRLIGEYLKENYDGQKFFYVTADYTWGWATEKSLREITNTEDKSIHGFAYTPFPVNEEKHFKNALKKAKQSGAKVLIMTHFGKDFARGIKLATEMGLKDNMQIIAPSIEINNAELIGPEYLRDVIGMSDWCWNVPYYLKNKKGIEFVEKYTKKFNRYPSWATYLTYTILYQYKDAVERAGSFEQDKVIEALRGHEFKLLAGESKWRAFDHQLITELYLVKMKSPEQVSQDPYQLDFFEIIHMKPGIELVRSRKQWEKIRTQNGLPLKLE